VIVEDDLAGNNRSGTAATPGTGATARTNRGEDYAFIFSPEFTPTKGMDLKPMFSWFHADGVTSGNARRNATNFRTVSGPGTVNGGVNSAGALGGGATAGDAADHEERYSVGLDAR
jgi:hypothetical protein